MISTTCLGWDTVFSPQLSLVNCYLSDGYPNCDSLVDRGTRDGRVPAARSTGRVGMQSPPAGGNAAWGPGECKRRLVCLYSAMPTPSVAAAAMTSDHPGTRTPTIEKN
jgi:hypothetical protein